MEIELDDRLRALIASAAKTEGITNFTTEAEPGSAKGDNYLGTITKVKVTDVESNKSLDFILKTATENSDFRKFVPMFEAFDRERYFYLNVLPIYDALLNEYDLPPFDSSPRLLESDMCVPEVLLMTDMKAVGYVMRNRKEYLDMKHVRLVMQAYGKLHGLYYALKTLKPDVCKELYDNMAENFFANIDVTHNQASVDTQNERVRKCLKEEDTLARERFEEFCKDTCAKILKHMDPKAAGRFAVINHGDSWVNNMLFAYNGKDAQEPTHLCLLDFQLARIGSPAMDLSYFIFTCTSKKLRDQRYGEIIRTYHDSMRDLLSGFSLNVEDYLTLDELDEQMRQFSLFGINMTLAVTHMMLSEPDEIPEFQQIKIDEKMNVEETFKSFDYVSKNEEAYLERMRGVLTDCAEKGYL